MSPTAPRTVLVLAGEFPPLKTIGRLRTVKFVEHLRTLGWQPIVLSVAARPDMPAYDPSLETEVPDGVEVLRAPWPDLELRVASGVKRLLGRNAQPQDAAAMQPAAQAAPPAGPVRRPWRDAPIAAFKWLLRHGVYVPDDYLPWAWNAYRMAAEVCRTRRVDVVYASLPPFSSALAAARLKARFGLPVVYDYRDLWHGDVLREWLGPVRTRLELAMERRIMRHADVIITVSEQKTEYVRRLVPRSRARFETLTNGYDEEIFAPLLEEPRVVNDTVDFVFTGRLFKNRRGYAFAEALGQLAREDPSLRERVRVHIIGGVSPEIQARYDSILATHGIQELYNFTGDIDYQAAMRAQVQADYLLLIVDTGATSSGVIPGKLFEYVASRRPIFALVDQGATQEIIERGRLGWVVPAESVDVCRETLREVLSHPVPQRMARDEAYLAQFDRRAIATRFAGILDELAGTPAANAAETPT